MSSLLNPLLIQTGILQEVAKDIPKPIIDISRWWFLVESMLLPLLIIVGIAFFLRHRYDQKQQRARSQNHLGNSYNVKFR